MTANRRVVLVAFNGELMCFVHVLLNAVDMHERGYDVKVIIEGAATALVGQLGDESKPFSDLYAKVIRLGLVESVCRACSVKMGGLAAVEAQGLPLGSDMKGHPALSDYIGEGYQIITF